MTAAVDVRQVTVRYGSTLVLDSIDLRISEGAAVALVGENGSGKSTLLRCVTGLQEPTAGDISVFAAAPGRGADFWRQVATTVESPSWYQGLTVREHLDLVRVVNGGDPDDGHIAELCVTLGLTGLSDSLPSTLSSGQRQRFLLAATLVRPSRLLVLDEPEQRLDTRIKGAVAAYLRSYVATGGTLVMASHDDGFRVSVGAGEFVLIRPGAE
ncbi:ABC transporter ATP-binding protein [Salinispora tropica]|nr:ABC transporter ATP-binding protein [Salinispora tropica]